MLLKDEKEIAAAANKDLVLLIKEYARKGYEQAQGSNDDGFEKLWLSAFHADAQNTEATDLQSPFQRQVHTSN